jgi:hypothetical protein
VTKRATEGSHRTAAIALFTAMAVGASVLASCTSEPRDRGSAPPPPEVSSPKIKQARWQIKARGSGAISKVTRADKRRLSTQRPRLAGLVRDVYDSLFLYPSRRRAVLHRRFSKPAARTVVRSRAGVPSDAELVRTWSRRARISIQPDGARRAAAIVVVRARGQLRSKIFRIVHKATLWLERPKRLWRVIGFEVSQGPFQANKAKREQRKKSPAGKQRNKKKSKKQRRGNGDRQR